MTTIERTTTAPPTTQPASPAPRRVLVIGDSSAAAIRWVPGATAALRGAHFTLDLESCRRLIEPSCNGREGYRPSTAIQALRRQAPGDHDTLVIAAGYNDTYDRFNEAFELILAEADRQGIDTVLWATYRENVGYELPSGLASGYEEMNRALGLRALSGNHPELQILDWRTYTAEAPGWLAGDGVHYRRAGAYGMADLISRSVAALDGRPCPVPWEPGSPPMDPCPPPLVELERRGGVPPVVELYAG